MAPVPIWFKGLSFAMASLLAVCVALQYNDPDPLRWMAIYGAGALVSALLPAKRRLVPVAVLVGLVSAGWAIYLAHSVWGLIAPSDLPNKMSEKGGAVEVGREAGGLVIQAVWLLAGAAFRRTRA